MKKIERILFLVGKANLKMAIEELSNLVDEYSYYEHIRYTILIEQDYNSLESAKLKGTISFEEESLQRHKICDRILLLIEKIKEYEGGDLGIFLDNSDSDESLDKANLKNKVYTIFNPNENINYIKTSAVNYGIRSMYPFVDEVDPISKKVYYNSGEAFCRDRFSPMIRKGEKIYDGYMISKIFSPIEDQREIILEIFYSENKNVRYIDEPISKLLSKISIPIENRFDDLKVDFFIKENNLLVYSSYFFSSVNRLHASIPLSVIYMLYE